MAAYFIDFDGVFFLYSTHIPAPGALEYVKKLKLEGHQIFFVTKRCYGTNNDPNLELSITETKLKELGVTYDGIIGGVSSPRIIINDEGAEAINHIRNSPLN
jgi:ribonucleotide monophosphatase NagD (HAD superfamily)